jgi:hypothetical protein
MCVHASLQCDISIVFISDTSLLGYALLNASPEQQRTISMSSNDPLANAPLLRLQSFCTTGDSSSLATRVTLTQVSRGKSGRVLHKTGRTFEFVSVPL